MILQLLNRMLLYNGYVHIWTQFPQLHVDKTPGWGGGGFKRGASLQSIYFQTVDQQKEDDKK